MTMQIPGNDSYQALCSTLYDWSAKHCEWQRQPSPANLCRARMSFTLADCATAWRQTQAWMDARGVPAVAPLLPGLRVFGVDGTILHMLRTRGLTKAFGVDRHPDGTDRCHHPQALLVSVWDLERRTPVAWRLSHRAAGERNLLDHMLEEIPLQGVIVMDRGYPGKDILHQIVASAHHFIVRMVASEAGGSWPVVRDFLASGATSADVLVPLSLGDDTSPTRVRLIRRNHPEDGQPLVIMVHLPNNAARRRSSLGREPSVW
jgi:hypothetical protein